MTKLKFILIPVVLIAVGAILFLGATAHKKSPEKFLQQAQKYLTSGDYRLAMMNVNKAVVLRPGWYEAYMVRGELHEVQGLLSMAIEDFNRAMAIDPSRKPAYIQRGLVYRRIGKYELAKEDLDRVIALDPEDPEAYLQRGQIHAKQRQYDEALDDFRQVSGRRQDHPGVHKQIGQIYEWQQDYAGAESEYLLALNSHPVDVEALVLLGTVYARQNKIDEGIRTFGKALSLDPRRGDVYYKRSFLYFSEGLRQQALDDIVRAQYLGQTVDPGYVARLKATAADSPHRGSVKK